MINITKLKKDIETFLRIHYTNSSYELSKHMLDFVLDQRQQAVDEYYNRIKEALNDKKGE